MQDLYMHAFPFISSVCSRFSSPSGSKGLGSEVDVSSVVVISDVPTESCVSWYGKRKCTTQLYKSYI